MSKREKVELTPELELARVYLSEAERLVQKSNAGPDREKAELYLSKSREMVTRFEAAPDGPLTRHET